MIISRAQTVDTAARSGETASGAGLGDAPRQCVLCDSAKQLAPLDFRQLYSQNDAEPIQLPWWRCEQCGGWFVWPAPCAEAVARHWATVEYADASHRDEIGQGKRDLFLHILS